MRLVCIRGMCVGHVYVCVGYVLVYVNNMHIACVCYKVLPEPSARSSGHLACRTDTGSHGPVVHISQGCQELLNASFLGIRKAQLPREPPARSEVGWGGTLWVPRSSENNSGVPPSAGLGKVRVLGLTHYPFPTSFSLFEKQLITVYLGDGVSSKEATSLWRSLEKQCSMQRHSALMVDSDRPDFAS